MSLEDLLVYMSKNDQAFILDYVLQLMVEHNINVKYVYLYVQYCAEGYDTPQKLKFMSFNWTKSHKKYSVSL